MKIPNTVVMFKSEKIKDAAELEYCSYVNNLIRKIAMTKGKASVSPNFAGTSYIYRSEKFICTYKDSDYGNDNYHFEINKDLWNDIPTDVNPVTVCDEGFNLVYSFQDSADRQILMQHIPGTWIEVLNKAI